MAICASVSMGGPSVVMKVEISGQNLQIMLERLKVSVSTMWGVKRHSYTSELKTENTVDQHFNGPQVNGFQI